MNGTEQRLAEIARQIHLLNPEGEAFPYDDCFTVRDRTGEQPDYTRNDTDSVPVLRRA